MPCSAETFLAFPCTTQTPCSSGTHAGMSLLIKNIMISVSLVLAHATYCSMRRSMRRSLVWWAASSLTYRSGKATTTHTLSHIVSASRLVALLGPLGVAATAARNCSPAVKNSHEQLQRIEPNACVCRSLTAAQWNPTRNVPVWASWAEAEATAIAVLHQ